MSKQTIRVLLVEDNRVAQLAVRLNLQQLNCTVDIASTGEEALTFASENAYDLILMDIGLIGDLDGFAVSRHIRKDCHKNLETPIIALTAHSGEDYRKLSVEAGMNDYMVKPLSAQSIREVLLRFAPPQE
jgi:two-component system aerobic respiration control sensor histidine kinase ArcB